MTIDQHVTSVEALAERRSDDVEFADLLSELRASPRTQDMPTHELEQRARAVWTRFKAAPIRAFVPILVQREVLRALPAKS